MIQDLVKDTLEVVEVALIFFRLDNNVIDTHLDYPPHLILKDSVHHLVVGHTCIFKPRGQDLIDI